VKVLEKVTVPVFLERLKQLGFQHLTHTPDYYGLGLTLGSGEVSLWELAQAYLIMANQGKIVTPNVIINQTKDIKNSQLSIDTPVTWQLITNMLSDPHARAHSFGIDSVLNLPFSVAVKTGTSSNYRDTWTVGFTTDYTVATWVGNFDGQGMQNVSGVTGAAPLWNRILLHLHETKEPGNFPKPEGLVELPICATTGLHPTKDCSGGIVLEYFDHKAIAEYEKKSHKLVLNSEYNEWLSRQSHPQLTQNQLTIISPQTDNYFVINSGKTAKLEFKITGNSQQSVEWWLNNKKLNSQSDNSLFWQLQPGEWKLTVKQGNQQDSVQFQVQEAKRKPHRGFSVVN
jgi:Membrane carboxypeptidase/penicillin-binding protein PbpC